MRCDIDGRMAAPDRPGTVAQTVSALFERKLKAGPLFRDGVQRMISLSLGRERLPMRSSSVVSTFDR